jgi:hypothetical protein
LRVFFGTAAALLAVTLSTGPIHAEEQTFDQTLAVPDASDTAPELDESPGDYLYAHYANAAQIDCLISRESRWRDVANAQGSGAVGYGQYMPSTWQRYQSESGRWDASPDDVYDVFAAMDWDLARGRRAQWSVRGC